MIFKKLKREFPQFANLQANRVSELTHAQRVQVAKAIWHKHDNTIHTQQMRNRVDVVHNILTDSNHRPMRTYQNMDEATLKSRLYRALKAYYNE